MEYAEFAKKLPPQWLSVTRTREKHRIRYIEGFVQPQECLQLINLGQIAAGLCGKPELGPRDIETVVLRRPSYTLIADLIDCVRRDLAGNDVAVETRLVKRDSGVRPPRLRPDIKSPAARRWMLFLNHDYEGGELYFPRSWVWMKPLAGCAVVWPVSDPSGIAPIEHGCQFALEGLATPRGSREPWLVELKAA